MISAIIPTYRNPKYLDLCLRSATENKKEEDTEIIVVIDGYVDESLPVVEKYEGVSILPLDENMGMGYAFNVGIYNASNPYIFIENDDNVFGPEWDYKMKLGLQHAALLTPTLNVSDTVLTINQVEPSPGIYDFHVKDFGRTADTFNYDAWIEYEPTIAKHEHTGGGRIFPFLISKNVLMAVGGFDLFYKSPFWVDKDLMLRLELLGMAFQRCHSCHLYHFGSIATKNRGDAEAEVFKRSEGTAAEQFNYKWNYIPNIVDAALTRNNSNLPNEVSINGVKFQK
jgi:GT2 family glycosyltransferase